MEIQEFLKLLNRKKQTIFSIMLLFVLFTTVLTVIQPFKYEAKSRILLLQHGSESADPYNAAKYSEFIGSLFAQVVPSNMFLNDVFESGFNVDRTYFGDNAESKLKKWQKTAEASAINNTGVIEIRTYHTDKSQTELINSAIINIIQTKNSQYYGRNEDISIKVIDEPIVSDWPVRPNIVVNFSVTLVAALLISFAYVYLFPEEEYNLSVVPKRKKVARIEKIREEIIYPERKVLNQNIYKPEPKIEPKIESKFVPNTNNATNFVERGDMKNIFDQSQTK